MSKELIERLRVFAGDPVLGGVIEEAADRIEELERDLLNLVCRIHRDGGHYIAKYGEAKAIADADTVAAQNNADLDALQDDRDEWKARAEFSYKQRDELEREIERKMSAAAFVLKERDALLADNARLREAMKEIRDDFDCDNDAHRYGATCRCCLAEKTLAATPEQSLARYHNEVVEKCAKGCDAEYRDPHNLPAAIVAKRCADTVRAMKEPE